MNQTIPKPEYPRMQLQRNQWLNLNGVWEFDYDDDGIGVREQWFCKPHLKKQITVPFAPETKGSGIGCTDSHPHVWYLKTFSLPTDWEQQDCILHFGAVDYTCNVYLNDQMVGSHTGGHTSFSLDVTPYLQPENKLVVYAYDPSFDETIPRGKQFWEPESRGIWYTKTTGIWQTVWIEPVPRIRITRLKLTPDIDTGLIHIETELNQAATQPCELSVAISLRGNPVISACYQVSDQHLKVALDVFQKHIFSTSYHGPDSLCWSPEHPVLFDLSLCLSGDFGTDTVTSYFGMRNIRTEDGMVYLNHKRYFQKLILDQGYWPETGMTAPEDQALIADIKHAKSMGFNGCRKHQKVEEERFLYWADQLGFLVWEEMPSGISYDDNYVERMCQEWMQVVKRDYNHPAIVTWVPLNESWGIPNVSRAKTEQSHSLCLYYLTHSLDDTRLVISNDGWELTKTDVCAIHNYNHGSIDQQDQHRAFAESLRTKDALLSERPSGRPVLVEGFRDQQVPILLTEFGGISFVQEGQKDWGYTHVASEEAFLQEYHRLISAIAASEILDGFCYTQLTDVEFEVNGLLTYDRTLKFDPTAIKQINDLCVPKTVKP